MTRRLLPFELASTTGTLTDAQQISVADDNLTGIITGAADTQEALDRVDGTGLGAQPRTFSGSFIASSGNIDTWYGGRQSVILEAPRGGTSGLRTFTLPGPTELAAMFDGLVAQGLGEVYTITIVYRSGSSTSIARNALTIRAPSVSVGFDRNQIPVTLAQGTSATFRLDRVGGTIGMWERISVTQATDPVATFGEVVLQNTSFNNADFAFLPTSAQVQKGYAFPVLASNPDDGTLRQGLLDGGVSDRVIYDGDYVVWTADAFTSWTNGDDWFVLSRDSLQRISREASSFLAQTSEIDNRVDIGFVSAMTNDALVWLSENPLAEAPFLSPASDPVNPRAGDTVAYVGGRDDRDADLQFQFGQNFNGAFMTVGITPSFITGHHESTIDILIKDLDGELIQRLNLATDFTFRDDATFTNGTVRHYTRATSVSYGFLGTIEIEATEVQRHFTMDPDTVNVTGNIPQRAIDTPRLALDVQTKLSQISQRTQPGLIFDTAEQKTRAVETINLLPGATHFSEENIAYAFFDASNALIGSVGTPTADAVAVPALATTIGFLPADTQRGTVRYSGVLYDPVGSITEGGQTYFLASLPDGITSLDPSPNVKIGVQSLEVVEQGLNNKERAEANTQSIEGLTSALSGALNITELAARTETDVTGYTYTGDGFSVSSTPVTVDAGVPVSLPARDIDANVVYGRMVAATDDVLLTLGATDFVRVQNNVVEASRFRATVPASSHTGREYVSESSGPGASAGNPIVMNAGYRTAAGNFQPEDSVISVTNNLPASSETVTISVDGIINGNDEGVRTFQLPYGQTTFASIDYVTQSGFDTTITFQARYRNNNNEIEIQLINPSDNLAVDGAHFNVLVTYDNTVVTPEVPSGRDWVRIGETVNGQSDFAIGMLVIGTDLQLYYNIGGVVGQFDTLTAEPTGLVLTNDMASIIAMGWIQAVTFDGVDAATNQTIFGQIVATATQDITDGYLGVRVATSMHEIDVTFSSQLFAYNSVGDLVNLAESATLVAPGGDRYALSVDDSGSLVTTKL